MSDHRGASTTNDESPRLRYVVVEGCIGVGKTTLTNILAERLNAKRVMEVVEENPFLADFYADQAAHAFKTQMFFLLSRFKQQEQIIQTELFEDAVVADYMFAKDRIFAELTLTGSELSLYDQVFQALLERVQVPDLVVYLQAPLDVILSRIKKRGRSFEQDIDPGYLEDLVGSYQRFFKDFDRCPLLVVDTEELNFPGSDAAVDQVMRACLDTVRTGGHRRLTTTDARQPRLV